MRNLLAGCFWIVSALGVGAQTCTDDRLALRNGASRADFTVEIVDTPEERAQGLMFREQMGTFEGMLFVYEAPSRVNFWMKNTLIPLDLLFADETGTITRIHEGAIPGDLTPIPGGNAVQYVLEINAQVSAMLGLAPGAQMQHPAIDQGRAAWPCE